MDSQRSYPLYWPEGWPRARYQNRARFGDHSIAEGRRVLQNQVRLFGGSNLIISSNLELRISDGLPRSNQKQPTDKGVAIYFTRNKLPFSMGIDVYTTVEDNLWALCRTLDAMRQIERDGSPELLNRAFRGFAALPDPDHRDWWDVLGVARGSAQAQIHAQYIILAKQFHPDNKQTGNSELFMQLQKAYEQALRESQ